MAPSRAVPREVGVYVRAYLGEEATQLPPRAVPRGICSATGSPLGSVPAIKPQGSSGKRGQIPSRPYLSQVVKQVTLILPCCSEMSRVEDS